MTVEPETVRFDQSGAKMPEGAPPQFDLVIAGARSSKSDGSKGTYSRAAVKQLLTSQLLAALVNLKPGGSLVVSLPTCVNITRTHTEHTAHSQHL